MYPTFISLRADRLIINFAPTQKPVLFGGQLVTALTPQPPIYFRSGEYTPKNDHELELLRKYAGNVANGGRSIREVGVELPDTADAAATAAAPAAPPPAQVPAELAAARAAAGITAPAPAAIEEVADHTQAGDLADEFEAPAPAEKQVYDQVTSIPEAVETLIRSPYKVDAEQLKSPSTGKFTKAQIRAIANAKGVSFPNL